MAPNRWLHLRHPRGFSPDDFELFKAQCRVFRAYVEAVLTNWSYFEKYPAPRYVFFEPELSSDARVASPLGGEQTIGSTATFENLTAWMLSWRFPIAFRQELEEGLTEPDPSDPQAMATSWRAVTTAIIRR